jgi:hypothetical protein
MSTTRERDGRLFLSYAHVDNEPLLPGQKGWIDNFQYTLKVRLRQLLGEDPEIFWDRTSLRGHDVFGAVIETDLVRCAVLVPVVSPSYVNFDRSEWCRKELELFCAAAEKSGGVRLGDHSRIFKVMKTPVPHERQPDPLKGLLGYEFYRKDTVTGRVREFALQPELGAVDPEYIQKIDDLATDIRDFLDVLSARAASTRAAATAAADRPVVYLAETTLDLTDERERVLRMLKQRGYTVLPDRPLPVAHGPALRQYVDECLRRASLAIHLVGPSYGAIPDGETASVIAIQNEIGAARSSDGSLARIIWIAPGIDSMDERQRSYTSRLSSDAVLQRGAEVVSCSLEEVETLVQDALRRPAPDQVSTQPLALKYVYLVCDRQDLEAARMLCEELHTCSEQLEISLPLFDAPDEDARAHHKQSLTACEGVLVYVGAVPTSWLEMKKLELLKMDGYARARPVAAKAIYLGPPATPAKDRFQSRVGLVIRHTGAPVCEQFQSFLRLLEAT